MPDTIAAEPERYGVRTTDTREADVRVEGLAWMGVRTERFQEMIRFYRDVLGLETLREGKDFAWFRTSNGTQVHIYGTGDADHSFFGPGPVVGFSVDDFGEMHARMLGAGIEFIGEVQRADGSAWNHFRAPDGNVYEIIGPG